MKTIKVPAPIQILNYSDGKTPLKRRALREEGEVVEVVPPMSMADWLEDVVFVDPSLNVEESGNGQRKPRSDTRQIMRGINRIRGRFEKLEESKAGVVDVEDYDYEFVLSVIRKPAANLPMSQFSQLEPFYEAWEDAGKKEKAEEPKA